MKAKQSKRARQIFSDEHKGRALLKKIREVSKKDPEIKVYVRDGEDRFMIREMS